VKLRTHLLHDPNEPLAVDLSSGVAGLDDDKVLARGRGATQRSRTDCQREARDCAQSERARRTQETDPWRSIREHAKVVLSKQA